MRKALAILLIVICLSLFPQWIPIQASNAGVPVGTYGSYGGSANRTYNTGSYSWDIFPTYGSSDNPPNNFNFAIITAEYGQTGQGANFNNYLRAIRSQNRIPFYRLFWGYDYSDIAIAKTRIQSLMVGVDTSLLGGVIFGDNVRWNNATLVTYFNSMYDWFKSTYPGISVYQLWSPLENEGPYNGQPGFQSSWKADGWVWYSYWANYNQTKGFITSCKTAQPNKPIIMIVDYSPPLGGGFDPYAYTPQQVQVAKEQGCSICLFSYNSGDGKYGWWSSDPIAKQRYAAGVLLDGNTPQPKVSTVATLTVPKPVLVVLYKNGTYQENVKWNSIAWGQVDKVGAKRADLGRVGFETTYGAVLWYPPQLNNDTQPLMYIAQRFWGEIGTTWYNFYINSPITRTPWIRNQTDGYVMGWNGTITYSTYNFKVSMGVKLPLNDNKFIFKTNVTTPIALTNTGIEYLLYVNPYYASDAAKHIKYVRLYFLNGTTEDLAISTFYNRTRAIPNMIANVGLVSNIGEELNQFNFTDIFSISSSKWIRIESATLPNGNTTYVLRIGALLGPKTAGSKVIIDPSTVGTSTHTSATQLPFQRKTFYAVTRFWSFFFNGSGAVYTSSLDGITWNTLIYIRAIDYGYGLSIDTDETYVYYAMSKDNGANLYYRRGLLSSTGAITWDTERTAHTLTGSCHAWPSIKVDSNGYPFISYSYSPNTTTSFITPYVIKSSTNDGTWVTDTGFPFQLNTTTGANWRTAIVSLSNSKMYVVYNRGGDLGYICGRLYHNSIWNTEERASLYKLPSGGYFSTTTNGDTIYLAYTRTSTISLRYNIYIYNSGWGTDGLIQSSVTSTTSPVLSYNTANNTLYCFWIGSPTAQHIYYKKYSGAWDTDATDWITEIAVTANDRLTCFYNAYNSYIGILYMNKTANPYQIRFAYLYFPTAYTRSLSMAVAAAFTDYRTAQYKRAETMSVATTFTDYRKADYKRIETMAITTAFNIYEYFQHTFQAFTRTLTMSIATAFSDSRQVRYTRTETVTVTTAFSNSRQVNYRRTETMTIASDFSGPYGYYHHLPGIRPGFYYFNFYFIDADGNIINSRMNWELWNGTQKLTYTMGTYDLTGSITYTLKSIYSPIIVNITSIDATIYKNSTVEIFCSMKPHNTVSGGFIALNTTLPVPWTIATTTPTDLIFTIGSTSGHVCLLVDVPSNATQITQNGSIIYGWTYHHAILDYIEYNSSANLGGVWHLSFVTVAPTITPYNETLMLFFILVPLILGFLFVRRAPIVSLICAIVLFVDSATLANNPYVATQYQYASGAWHTYYVTLPFHPLSEILLVFMGVMILLLVGLQRGQ